MLYCMRGWQSGYALVFYDPIKGLER